MYGGISTLPTWWMSVERSIAQLDFKMPDSFDLKGEKLLPEVSDDDVFLVV